MNAAQRLMAAAVLASLCACSGLGEANRQSINAADARASGLLREVGRAAPGVTPGALPAAAAPAVEREDSIWLDKKVVKAAPPGLPPLFAEPAVLDRTVYSLAEVAERISLRSGVVVKINQDAHAVAAATLDGSAGQRPGAAAAGQPPGGMAAAAGAAAPVAGAPARSRGIRITHTSGSLKSLLDTCAARFGVSWKYAGGVIQFFHTDSRTFQINALPGDTAQTANVSSGASSANNDGSGDGVNSNNKQITEVKSQLSVYASLEKSVSAMLSPAGKVVASPATGSMTVVDTPEALERVAAFIAGENQALSRQIAINVTVLAVTLNDKDAYGIKWDLVYSGLRDRYGVKNVLGSLNGASFMAGVLESSSSRFAGSQLLIEALSEQGQVRRQTTASVVTLNNQPVPVQVAKQTSYLKSSQTTVTPLVGSTTTLTPGVVTSGFNMSILPHMLDNGTVMLQFSTDISALRSLKSIESNNSSLQTPELDTRNFLQRIAMKSNETLVISGFEQTDDNLDREGVGSAANFLFGGGVRAQRSKEVIVILVTPTTMAG